MLTPGRRWRPLFLCTVAVAAIWIAAAAIYIISKNARVTAEKVTEYADSVDLGRLSDEERARAIRKLADMLNALSVEERRTARFGGAGTRWFGQMTEAEKADFIELTMPTGFKQMLTAFEQLPEDRRRKTIDDALRRLREARNEMASQTPARVDTNSPVLSEDLQARIRTIGLRTFYSQSSAQTKAELAPVLEELQRIMESGRPFRHPGR